MKKRYEDYSCEEIKAAMLDPIERERLVKYIYGEVCKMVEHKLYTNYKKDAKDWVNQAYATLIVKINDGTFKCNVKNPLKSLKSFWVRISFFLFLNWVDSSQNTVNQADIANYDEAEEDEEEEAVQQQRKRKYIQLAFDGLGETCKTVISATELQDKSYKEILADKEILEKTGQTTNDALRQLKTKCMNKFRLLLSQYFDSNGYLKI